MNPISQTTLTASQQTAPTTPTTKTASTSPLSASQHSGIVVEISPGADNVSSGDRSQNSAQISISTPNKSIETEISRAQFFDSVERRAQKNIAQAYSGQENNVGGKRKYLAAQSGALQNDSVEALATTRLKKNQASAYAASYQKASSFYENPSTTSATSSSNNSPSYQTNNALNAYNQAQQSAIKQELVFSTIDRLGTDLKV